MNVCIVNEGGAFGGAEIHTLHLVRRLAQGGHRVRVIECREPVMERKAAEQAMPVGVSFTTVPLSTDMTGLGDARRWLAELRRGLPEHVILIKNYFLRGSLPFLYALRRSSPRVSYIEHLEALPAPEPGKGRYLGLLPRLELWRHRDRIRRRLPAAFADRIVAVSAQVRERLITDCDYPANKISVARNGVEHQSFVRNESEGISLRERFGIPADRCLLTILARIEQPKGIDVALRALALAREAGNHGLHLLIAGTGSQETRLRQMAQELGLARDVTFAGFLADPRPALWASQCILFASRREGLPLGLLEGMAAGCLPVVTRVSGMPEVITRPELGWVVEPEDAAGLARALGELARLGEAERRAFSRRVVAHVEENFDLRKSQDRLVEQLGL